MDKQVATALIRIMVILIIVGFIMIYRNLNGSVWFSEYEGLMLTLIAFAVFFWVGCENIQDLNDMFEFK